MHAVASPVVHPTAWERERAERLSPLLEALHKHHKPATSPAKVEDAARELTDSLGTSSAFYGPSRYGCLKCTNSLTELLTQYKASRGKSDGEPVWYYGGRVTYTKERQLVLFLALRCE